MLCVFLSATGAKLVVDLGVEPSCKANLAQAFIRRCREPSQPTIETWCATPDLHWDALRHGDLNPARLLIPTAAHLKLVARGGIAPPSNRVRSALPFLLDQQATEKLVSPHGLEP